MMGLGLEYGHGHRQGCPSHDPRDWSAMPSDFLASIFQRLDDYEVDRRRVGAVCRSWRSALLLPPWCKQKKNNNVPPSTSTPLEHRRLLPGMCSCKTHDTLCQFADRYRKYSSLLRETTLYILFPLHDSSGDKTIWLIRAEEEEGSNNKWVLHDARCWKFDNYLPQLELDTSMPQHNKVYYFNLLDEYRILGVSKLTTLHHVFKLEDHPASRRSFEYTCMPAIRKAVPVSLGNNARMIMVLFDYTGSLAFWSESAGQPQRQWCFLNMGDHQIEDIIYFEGQFHGVDTMGNLVSVSTARGDHDRPIHIKAPFFPSRRLSFDQHLHLVVSEGSLYLVREVFGDNPLDHSIFTCERKVDIPPLVEFRPSFFKVMLQRSYRSKKTPDVEVYVLSKCGRAWERVQSLGNKVFFIANYVTFSLSAMDLSWTDGSFIYFMHKEFDIGPESEEETLEVFLVKDFVATKQAVLSNHMTMQFWPPPTWLRTPNGSG